MHYHIILTESCDSRCTYCYEKSMKEFDNGLDKRFKFDFSAPEISQVDPGKLKAFLQKDKNPVLIFYGGEPLLQIEKIKEIVDTLKDTNAKFRMQTNAKLLHLLPAKYLNKIDKILVSLDGTKERTDFNRGKGTYDLVMKNLESAKKAGYNGELIARMTISQFPDLYEQVQSLIKSGFTSIHWQLDAGFFKFDYIENNLKPKYLDSGSCNTATCFLYPKNPTNNQEDFFDDKKKFSKFVEEYNKSVSKLIEFWLADMKTSRRVLKIYPFVAIIDSLLKSEKTRLRCGAGHEGYAITTDGKIVACPIMNNIVDFEAGDLDTQPSKLKKFDISECSQCDSVDLCGGRCLYWRKAKLWPQEGDDLICRTIKFYINKLKEKMPEINELIKKGIIKKEDFEYEKYFGPEIIP